MNPSPVADNALTLFLLAGELGRFSMLLYGAGLLVLMLLVTLVARGLFVRPGASLRLGPGALAVIGGCLLVFAGLAAALVLQPVLTSDLDQRFLAAMTTHGNAGLTAFFAAFTRLADTVVLTVLCIGTALVLLLSAAWRGRAAATAASRWLAARGRVLALGWVLAVAGNALLNFGLKALFDRARPLHDNVAIFAKGLSFPSGHTSGAVAAYGMLAFILVRWLQGREAVVAAKPAAATAARTYSLVVIAAFIAWSTGWSRLVLQVHFPTDVMAGFASGTAWLTVCILATEALLRRTDFLHSQLPIPNR